MPAADPAADPVPQSWWRREAGELGRSLTRFGPAPGPRWHLGLQAATAMAVPVIALSAIGYESIGLLAATGAFATLYGGRFTPRERIVVVPIVAALLWACAAAGVLAAVLGPVVVAAGLVVVAVAASALVFGLSVGPPGPLFPVLIYGLSAHVTAPTASHRGLDPGLYLAVLAASLAFAWVVTAIPALRSKHRRTPPRPLSALFPRAHRETEARTLVVRAAAVAIVGTAASLVVDPERAYWIVGAGIAVLGVSTSRRVALSRGIHRALGTAVGAGVYLAIAFVPLPGIVLGVVLGALQFVVELVVVRHYALALLFITPLVLLILGAAGGSGPELAIERVVDTAVGAALGTLSSLIVVRGRTPRAAA
ncbi:FUSC family protein [Microbacterium sp. NM3R9]|uniref:FUSC family protein n=1 Tax=Microbacterium thalli TaxID=3027921 RepID=UPI002365BC6F|nr:FUSC family protein [Microbacterium thalli]MDN8547719.1 FUSC family protein [Microbacterium thalli]